MVSSGSGRTNGTYHAAAAQKQRVRQTRLLVAIGALLSMLGIANIALINSDMTRIEQSGPERLALAGGGLDHFVPSILANLPRAQAGPNTVTNILAGDPRRSVPFIEDKRALERWMAFTGFGLAALFVGLQSSMPISSAHPRSPTGADLSRLMILVGLAYGGLSFFENG